MKHTAWIVALLCIAILTAEPAFAQTAGCPEPAAATDVWKQALLQIDRYRITYVLVYADNHADKITSFGPPASTDVKIGAMQGTAAEAARKHGISLATEYPLLPDPDRIAQDLMNDTIQGAVIWGPLAGWLIGKHDPEHKLSIHVAPESTPPPAEILQISTTVDPAAVTACSDTVRALLEGYGVVPAEAFKLDIFEVTAWKTAPAGNEDAQQGGTLFGRYCASCHGQNAIRKPGLAPVDLLKTVKRSTYGGFSYMTLHGRNAKGMPGYHGILDQDQLRLLYQYIRDRSAGRL